MNAVNKITTEDIKRFENFKDQSPNMINLYQEIATKSAIYPGIKTPLGLAYVALKLNGEAGEFAEHVGKAMRDDKLIDYGDSFIRDAHGDYIKEIKFKRILGEREIALIKEIGDVLWYLSAACNELHISLSDVALINLVKLHDRTERNALQGGGDNR